MELFRKRESLVDMIMSFHLLKINYIVLVQGLNPNKLTLIRFFPPLAWFLSMKIVGRWKYILLV